MLQMGSHTSGSASAPQFLFENFGSRGDIAPLIAIAGELVRRGHRCQLLANERFRGEAERAGIRFWATSQWCINSTQRGEPLSYMFRTFEGVRGYFQQPCAQDE